MENDEENARTGLFTYDHKTKLAVASTSAVDRHGETIDQSGWDLKSFKENPVLLWAHDHSIPAIGAAKNIRVSSAGGEKRLVFEPQFNEATDFSKAIKFLYEGDENTPPTLNSFSVGFIVKDMDGNNITKQELLEISAVNVPANAEARMLAYKSLKDAGFKKKTIKELGIDTELLDKVNTQDKDIAELRDEVKELRKEVEAVKTVQPKEAAKKRLSMLKVIARASDKLLEGEKKSLPRSDRKNMVKVIKQATEHLTTEDKKLVS